MMKLTIAPRGVLQIDDARIIFRNFTGAASKYNRAGDKNFAIVIPNEEMADALVREGWNVKIRPPREEGGEPFMYLQVKIKYNGNTLDPKAYLVTGNRRNELDEDSIECLDNVDILRADLDISPYDWVMHEGTSNEKRGRSAYLKAIEVTQEIDRFADRHAEEDEEDPF